jgi:type IX secretion system PorP/SprF family membrane protein
MMKRKWSYLFLFVLLFGGSLTAQQMPMTTQYLFNPYALNQAVAGYFNYSEIYLNYRREWTNIANGPKTVRLNGFGNVYKEKMWVGGEMYMDKTGAISQFKASVSYSYVLQTAEDQRFFFGVWANFFQNSVRLADMTGIDPTDPLLTGSSAVNGSAFNAGFGLDYNWQGLNVGFAMPNALADNSYNKNPNKLDFRLQREFLLHASYLFALADNWQLQTMAVYRKVKNMPGNFELSAMALFMKQVWAGILYRNTGAVAINIGGYAGYGLMLNYSFEFGTGGINKGSGTTHEITLSYRFGQQGRTYFENKNGENYGHYRRSPAYRRRPPHIIDYR